MTTTHHQRQVNRIIAMFCKAIKPPEERQPFDRKPFRVDTNPKLAVIRHYAELYGIDQRTAYRYQAQGVDLADAAAVAIHISNLKHPSEHALDRIAEILKSEIK